MNFTYYKLNLKLASEQLGTCTEVSIYNEHVLQKAKKSIAEANRLAGKVTKALAKFAKQEMIGEIKELEELKGIIRKYHEVLGRSDTIPDKVDEILAYSQGLQEEFDALVKSGEERKSTIFMRGEDGHPVISSHMILGNLKENLRIIVNNSSEPEDKKKARVRFKSQVAEIGALDVKVVEAFIRPSNDIVRGNDGKPTLLERPIRFERMGKVQTAIALSEYLPVGTEYECHLRVRTDSPFNDNDAQLLKQLLDMGKNNGLGQWRGSGSKGQFFYKIEKVDYNPTNTPEGWS